MKQFVFGMCAVLLLTLVPVRAASAQGWGRHTGPGPMGAGADTHAQWPKWPKPHIGRSHQEKLTPLYTSPKPVGWWHKSPARMGAGADTQAQGAKGQKGRISRRHNNRPTQLTTWPRSEGRGRRSRG